MVYVEAKTTLLRRWASSVSSDEPFNRWFRDQMKEVHGATSEPGPPAEKVFDARRAEKESLPFSSRLRAGLEENRAKEVVPHPRRATPPGLMSQENA